MFRVELNLLPYRGDFQSLEVVEAGEPRLRRMVFHELLQTLATDPDRLADLRSPDLSSAHERPQFCASETRQPLSLAIAKPERHYFCPFRLCGCVHLRSLLSLVSCGRSPIVGIIGPRV